MRRSCIALSSMAGFAPFGLSLTRTIPFRVSLSVGGFVACNRCTRSHKWSPSTLRSNSTPGNPARFDRRLRNPLLLESRNDLGSTTLACSSMYDSSWISRFRCDMRSAGISCVARYGTNLVGLRYGHFCRRYDTPRDPASHCSRCLDYVT